MSIPLPRLHTSPGPAYTGLKTLLAALLLGSIGLAAAAEAPQSIRLSPEDSARIRGIQLNSAIPQDDIKTLSERYIRTQVVNTAPTPGAGGIIGAIIGGLIADAIINSQIKKRMEQSALAWPTITESVADFDFRKDFWNEIRMLPNAGPRFKIAASGYFPGERPYMDYPETTGGIPLDAILDLHTEYILGPGMKTLQVSTQAALRTRAEGKEIYRATYTFTTPPVSSGEYQDAANSWAHNKGERYRAAMRLAAVYTARMLWLDLLGPEAPASNLNPEQILRAADLDRQERLFNTEIGNVVEKSGDLFIVRNKTGNMVTVIRGTEFVAGAAPAGSPSAASTPAPAGNNMLTLDDLRDLLSPSP